MAGMSRAARDGIIIRSSATLEKLHRVRAFAFDKTGTLTRGEPTLVDVRPEEGTSPDTLLRLAASVEANSTHTLARATLRGAGDRGLALAESDDAEGDRNGVIAAWRDAPSPLASATTSLSTWTATFLHTADQWRDGDLRRDRRRLRGGARLSR